MTFLGDAHLPRRLARKLQEAGHDAIHPLDPPKGNRSTDSDINEVSVRANRVVITKYADFVNSFLFTGQPYKLLVVPAGNVTNAALEALFLPNISAIVTAFQTHGYIELTPTALIVPMYLCRMPVRTQPCSPTRVAADALRAAAEPSR
ncbi:MAG: DUF5615 family PIN-like protein [Chloroflexaceae bacterium]|nr:DUF5615 family PIN-like protein [Chloroflexaceae bacterium]